MKLVNEEIFKGRGCERSAVGGEQGGVDDIAPAGRCGALDLEGTGVGAPVRSGGVIVLAGCRGDEVLVTGVRDDGNAVGGPVRCAAFIRESEGGGPRGM